MATSERLLTSSPPAPSGISEAALTEAFSRQLLSAMSELRSGNFDVRLPNDLLGIEGRIADAFNDLAVLNQQRAMEISRVCRMVGKEGKLKERIRVSAASARAPTKSPPSTR